MEYGRFLQPPARVLPGLKSGAYVINEAGNRVVDAASKKFVAALVPSPEVNEFLAALPRDPRLAANAIKGAAGLAKIEPLLKVLQVTSAVGAVASVVNVGVSFVGFALVLHRLSRVEGKLDRALSELDVIKQSVADLSLRSSALSAARLRSAGQLLDRALVATSRERRLEHSRRARDLFMESKNLHLELWRRTTAWNRMEIPVSTALEMTARFEAAALGEAQAEFVCGDMSAFRHSVRGSSGDHRDFYLLDAQAAFRARSDAACEGGLESLSRFAADMPVLTAALRDAAQSTAWTQRALTAFEDDASLPELMGAEPHEIAAASRAVPANEIRLLMSPVLAD